MTPPIKPIEPLGGFPIDLTVDDFEDGDIAEYDGSTAQFNTTNTRVQLGTLSLEGTNSGAGTTTSINSNSGLDNYPVSGQITDAWMWIPDAGDVYYVFNVNDTTGTVAMLTGDAIQHRGDNNLVLSDGNNDRFSTSYSRTVSQEWIRVEVDWAFSNPTIIISAFDTNNNQLASADTGLNAVHADQSHIGYVVRNVDGSTEGSAYYDDVRITAGF